MDLVTVGRAAVDLPGVNLMSLTDVDLVDQPS